MNIFAVAGSWGIVVTAKPSFKITATVNAADYTVLLGDALPVAMNDAWNRALVVAELNI